MRRYGIHDNDDPAIRSGQAARHEYNSSSEEMGAEPVGCQAGDFLERTGFLEQVAGAANDHEIAQALQFRPCLTIQGNDVMIIATDDQQGRRSDCMQGVDASQVGPAAARDHGRNRRRRCWRRTGRAAKVRSRPVRRAILQRGIIALLTGLSSVALASILPPAPIVRPHCRPLDQWPYQRFGVSLPGALRRCRRQVKRGAGANRFSARAATLSKFKFPQGICYWLLMFGHVMHIHTLLKTSTYETKYLTGRLLVL